MKLLKIVFLFGLALVFLACDEQPGGEEFRVVRISDGDSITVLNSAGQDYKVRISGIDAPELGQAFGRKSKESLERILTGEIVQLDVYKTDRYGRLVAKVWAQPKDCADCGKTLDVSMAQLTTGMAWWYRFWSKEQPEEDRHRYEFAEQEARAKKAGLWRDSNPINPHEWRRNHPRK